MIRLIEKSDLLGALARGYSRKKNKKKIMDPNLIEAMADEVIKLTTKSAVVFQTYPELNCSVKKNAKR